MKYAFVRAHRGQFRTSRMCEVLGVSRSGYYDWWDRPECKRREEDRALLAEICQVHYSHREAYGAVKTWQSLRRLGVRCGKHRIARLRRAAAIETKRRRKFKLAYQARNSAPAAPNLLNQRFLAACPNQIWVTDVSFVSTRSGWLYLAVVIDLYARLVVGWSMKERPNQELANEALVMALEQRGPNPGVIHHSDQGKLYGGTVYREILSRYGMIQSMSRKGNCYDNAVAESFFSSLKNELIHHRDFQTREQARGEIFEYIELFYNRRRLHQSLSYQTPMEYESMGRVA